MQQQQLITVSKTKVSLMREDAVEYPELWLEVFVAGPSWEQKAFADMFVKAKCQRAESPETADLVVFVGGVDVDPALYGQKAHPKTDVPDHHRDGEDMALYMTCLTQGIPMLGVCRGAQFLNVMNGGTLYQDVTNHVGDHDVYDIRARKTFKASSVHHQLVVRNTLGGMTVLADASRQSKKYGETIQEIEGTGLDVEAFFYRDTCSLGVQGHPEYRGYPDFAKWTLERIQELIVCSPDTELAGSEAKYRRLKQSFIDERDDAISAALAEKIKEII